MKEKINRVHARSIIKPGINDPEGNTILDTLHKLGYTNVTSVRVGKVLEFEVNESNVPKLVEELSDGPGKKDFPGLGSRVLNTYEVVVSKNKRKKS